MLDNGNYQRLNRVGTRGTIEPGIDYSWSRSVPCGLARTPRYAMERLPRTTAHAHLSRYTCPRFGLFSHLTDLLANRMPFSRPISVYSLCIRRVSNSNTLRNEFLRTYDMVNISWFRADPSLSKGSVIERNVVGYFSLAREFFKRNGEREKESWCNLGLGSITSEVKFV